MNSDFETSAYMYAEETKKYSLHNNIVDIEVQNALNFIYNNDINEISCSKIESKCGVHITVQECT